MEGTVETVETVEATIVDKGGTPPIPPAIQVEDGFSGKPGDLQKDLALLAGQTQEAPKAPEPVTPEPEQPNAMAPETPVPDKFKNPDGTVNLDRVAKSKEAALAEYREIERKLRQGQNQLAQQNRAPQQPAQPVQTPVQLSPLERSMAEDLIHEAASFGQQLPEWQAITQARVMARGLEAKHSAELAVTEDIRTRMEDQDRERELENIADKDAWVFTPEGIKALRQIRETRPHVNASKTPWMTAYREYLADEAMTQRFAGTVQTPTPKAPTVKAPPTPVGAAPRAVVQPTAPKVEQMSADQVTAYVKTLDPKAEAAFWASRGLKF